MRLGKTGFELDPRNRQGHCKRCGGKKRNASDLCFRCNYDFQFYMKDHPITYPLEKWEYDRRWEAFMHELVPTMKRLAKR